MIGTPSRFAKVDLPASWLQVSFGILLPFPKESTNISAVTKPLSLKVIQYSVLLFVLFYFLEAIIRKLIKIDN